MGYDLGALAVFFFAALFFDVIAVMAARPENRGDASIIFAGIVATAVGLTLAFVLAAFVPGSDKYVAVCVLVALGGLFGCVAANNVRDLFVCRVRVEAEYRGCEEMPTGQVMSLRYPICAYEFQGRAYCEKSLQSIGARRAKRMAKAGTCHAYLDPRHPATFIVRRSASLMTFILAAIALSCFGAALYVLCPPLTSYASRIPVSSRLRSSKLILRTFPIPCASLDSVRTVVLVSAVSMRLMVF